MKEEIQKLADANGLEIIRGKAGFSVKKGGVQISFIFNEEKLKAYLESYGKEDIRKPKFQENKTIPEEVYSEPSINNDDTNIAQSNATSNPQLSEQGQVKKSESQKNEIKNAASLSGRQELGIMIVVSAVCYGVGWMWIEDVVSHTDSLDRSFWKPNLFGDFAASTTKTVSLLVYVAGNILQIIGILLVPWYLISRPKDSKRQIKK